VLMRKGNAYRAADGSVYFKVSSFPAYGALSRVKDRELKVTNSVFDADHKDDVGDFALWKAHKPAEDGDIRWPGPEGAAEGRPGWHIECSAMSKKLLGDTIDLHTGGVDLLFPHHENEIAQSQCCNGATFARHWFHSEHLLVDNATMSKSKGNYYTLGDLVDKGYSPMAVRYALLAGRKPREQLNFTLDALHAAEKALETLRAFGISRATRPAAEGNPEVFQRFFSALQDDLNSPGALGEIFTIIKSGPAQVAKADFDRAMFALGLKLDAPAAPKAPPPPGIATLAEKRWAAKQARDFKAADALRAELAGAGWSMLDGKDGYKLEPIKK
jgi:cysteinyl-tRNA synthetase